MQNTYDNRNRLTNLSRTIDGTAYTLGLGYDAVGNVTSILYPGDTTPLTQVYDELNRLKAVNGFAGTTNTQGLWYDLAGRLTKMQYIIKVGMYWKSPVGRCSLGQVPASRMHAAGGQR